VKARVKETFGLRVDSVLDTQKGCDGCAAGLGPPGVGEVGKAGVDYMKGLVKKVGDGLIGRSEQGIEEVLSTPISLDRAVAPTSWKFCPHHSAACFPACPSNTAKYPCPRTPA
jgi:hypothetical protein